VPLEGHWQKVNTPLRETTRREKLLGKDTLHMRVDYSPFEGRKVPASPSHVLSRGELIVKDDQWVGKTKQGRGQFLRRGTFSL
jgi:dihydropyrimidinase